VVSAIDESDLHGIGQGVGHLIKDVIGADQFDHGSGLRCPEVLPPAAEGVLVLGDELAEQFQELGHAPARVHHDCVMVVGVGQKREYCISVRCAARARQ